MNTKKGVYYYLFIVNSFIYIKGWYYLSHYFTNDQLKSNLQKNEVFILDNKFIFNTDNGVFAKKKIDFGTVLLLESINIKDFIGKVLDIGCGYGVIGIVIAKLTTCQVDMIDINKRAIHLTKINIKENKLNNASCFESDCYNNVSQKYNYIITNPPIRAGKKIVYKILMRAKDYLEANGKLFLVIRKEQGAKSLINDLQKVYNVNVLAKQKNFFVIECIF